VTIAKAWAGLAGAIVTSLTAALSDDVFDINDGTQIALTVVSALGTMYAVYRTRNA
jgi:hypothetical protein